jgi:hypothetical protein
VTFQFMSEDKDCCRSQGKGKVGKKTHKIAHVCACTHMCLHTSLQGISTQRPRSAPRTAGVLSRKLKAHRPVLLELDDCINWVQQAGRSCSRLLGTMAGHDGHAGAQAPGWRILPAAFVLWCIPCAIRRHLYGFPGPTGPAKSRGRSKTSPATLSVGAATRSALSPMHTTTHRCAGAV